MENHLIQKWHNKIISLSLTTANYIMGSCVSSKPNPFNMVIEWKNILWVMLKQVLEYKNRFGIEQQPAKENKLNWQAAGRESSRGGEER